MSSRPAWSTKRVDRTARATQRKPVLKKQTNKQTKSERERERERQTDRQTDTHTHTPDSIIGPGDYLEERNLRIYI